MLSGLNGSVTLANGSDTRTLNADGAFTFATSLATGAPYTVSVTTQPSNQVCTVTNGSGSIASSNVTNVAVTCVTNTYSVGGAVSGLVGSGLVLQNNGADNLARSTDGAFTFATAITQGSAYSVTVLAQPTTPAQICTATNNTGTVSANVTNVAIACVTTPTVGSAVIGPAGGTVNGYYGAKIIIPAGALASPVTIGLARDSSNSPAFAVTDVDAVGATYELTPHGQSFTLPVTLHIPFDPEQVANDETPVLYKAEAGGAFAALPTTVNGNFIEATITNFSWVMPASPATKPRMVYALQHSAADFNIYELASFKINKTTGALSAASSMVAVGEAPTSVVAHPSGNFVYVAHAGNNTVNNIPPNSVVVYRLNRVNGSVSKAPTSMAATSAPLGYKPTMPVIHPSGKFLYVMNYGASYNNSGGDINLFSIDGATGALTRSNTVTSGGGAQPMGMVFNRLGTLAYVLYAGSTSGGNTFDNQIKTYTVNTTTGELTGPSSGVAVSVSGSNPFSIAIDPNDKFIYVATWSTDEVITYSINSGTGVLTNMGSRLVTAGSRIASLAVDSFGRFLFSAQQMPWYSKNLWSYQYNVPSGLPTATNGVLTTCDGSCTGRIAVVADPQGQFVYAVDGGLSGFSVDQTTGALSAVNSLTGMLAPGPIGYFPFTFAVTGTSPVWQNNCTIGCALSGQVSASTGSGGGGTPPSNPNPPTSHRLNVVEGSSAYGYVSSTPSGIDIAPGTSQNAFGSNLTEAFFPANTTVTLCTQPPPTAQAFDITWTGSCSGTGVCTSVTMTADKNCTVYFTDVSVRVP